MRGTVKVWMSSDLTDAEELKRTPLDVDVSCPRCGGETWDRVEQRAGPDWPTARVRRVVCRSCRHSEHSYPVGRLRRRESQLENDLSPVPDHPSVAELLAAAPFPVYVPDRPRFAHVSLAGRGRRIERLEAVGLLASDAGRAVTVWSYVDRGPLTPAELARRFLFRELEATLPVISDRNRDVATLKRNAATRPLRAAADAAQAETAAIPVEGGPKELELVAHQGCWAACGEGIIVAGRNVAPGEVALRLLRPDDTFACDANVPR